MTITDLKQLEALVKLCRKSGIASIEVDGIKFSLNPIEKRVRTKPEPLSDPLATASVPAYNGLAVDTEDLIAQSKLEAAKALQALKDEIATPDMLTEDQLLNWSSRPESFEGQQ